MSSTKRSVREFLELEGNGSFRASDVHTQIAAGWYDWFCKDHSLAAKTVKLTDCLVSIVNSSKINQDTMYVFFKNNCPMNGPLYDSFSICDMETNDVLFWVTPKSGHTGKAEVCAAPNFGEPAVSGSWGEVVRWFNR